LQRLLIALIPVSGCFFGIYCRNSAVGVAGVLITTAALYISALAFSAAAEAEERSESTLKGLKEAGLIVAETETEFKGIFDNHLIQPLRRCEDNPGSIYLLLSTPAYGYAVVGKDGFEVLLHALTRLHNECSVEFVFFSPDDHFLYWANVLLWSEVRKRENLDSSFAEAFSESINDMFNIICSSRPWLRHLWIVRTTTVRLFAFVPHNHLRSTTSVQTMPEQHIRVYLALTDSFSIPLDQFQAAFQAHGMRVLTTQHAELIREKESYFERVKVCPYTGRIGPSAEINPDLKASAAVLSALRCDYILGRTAQKSMTLDCFRAEIDVFFETEGVKNRIGKQETHEQFLWCVVDNTLKYYAFVLKDANVMASLSREQAARIKAVIKTYKEKRSDIHQDTQKAIQVLEPQLRQNSGQTEAERVPEEQTGNGGRDPALHCLYQLVTSGFRQSMFVEHFMKYPQEIETLPLVTDCKQ
jgi:hypothetical protein